DCWVFCDPFVSSLARSQINTKLASGTDSLGPTAQVQSIESTRLGSAKPEAASPEPPLFPQVLGLFAVVGLAHVAAQANPSDRRADEYPVLLVFDALVVLDHRRRVGLDVDAAALVAPAAVFQDHAAGERGGADAILAVGPAVVLLHRRVGLVREGDA